MLIDSHCHLSSEEIYENLPQIILSIRIRYPAMRLCFRSMRSLKSIWAILIGLRQQLAWDY